MNPRINPFNPGAGTQPPELSGRDRVLEDADVAISRVISGRSAQGQILVGLRGVGKTVLLNRIWDQAGQIGATALLIEANEKRSLPSLLLPELRRVLISLDLRANASEKVKKGMRVFRSFTTGLRLKHGEFEFEFGNVEPEHGTADTGNLETDLGQLFVAVAEAAQERKTALVLCIDELQNLSEPEFGALIMAVHKTTQRSLPLLLIGAGLPQIIALAGKSKSYAERLFLYPEIGPLSDSDARRALEKPVMQEGASFSSDALKLILEQTQGYPYFLQEWERRRGTPQLGRRFCWKTSAQPILSF
jgi:predicted ATPase